MVIGSFELDGTLVCVYAWRGMKCSGGWVFWRVVTPGFEKMKSVAWRDHLRRAWEGSCNTATAVTSAAVTAVKTAIASGTKALRIIQGRR